MPDLHDLFRRLARDITARPRPSAEELRERVERRRGRSRALAAVAAAAVTLAAFAVTSWGAGKEPARLVAVPSATATRSPSASPPPTPRPVARWLGAPWVLESSESSTWPAGRPGSYAFCGLRPYTPPTPMAVEQQRFVHPNGQRALLLKASGAAGASQIWKWSYAECRVAGRAESVGGPRNLWSYGAIAAGSQYVGPEPLTVEAVLDSSFYLVELTGPSAADPPTRREVEVLLDAWAGTGS